MIGATAEGDLRKGMLELIPGIKQAVTRAARTAGREAQLLIRGETSAALGQGIGNAWRLTAYPDRPGAASLEPAAHIWTKAPKVVDAFERAVPIRSPAFGMLAIPLPAAGIARGFGRQKKITPREWQRRTGIPLRLVRRPGRFALLVANNVTMFGGIPLALQTSGYRGRRVKMGIGRAKVGRGDFTPVEGRTTVAVFLLVPQVRAPKLLQLERYADAGASLLALALAREVDRR